MKKNTFDLTTLQTNARNPQSPHPSASNACGRAWLTSTK